MYLLDTCTIFFQHGNPEDIIWLFKNVLTQKDIQNVFKEYRRRPYTSILDYGVLTNNTRVLLIADTILPNQCVSIKAMDIVRSHHNAEEAAEWVEINIPIMFHDWYVNDLPKQRRCDKSYIIETLESIKVTLETEFKSKPGK